MWKYGFSNELYHHGIKGQRWGIRRYQNEDGSLTPAGKKRYKKEESYSKEKKVGAYTDDELLRMTKRNNLESNYYESVNRRNSNSSKNKKSVNTSVIFASVLIPAIATYAKELAKDSVKNGSKSILATKMAKIEREIHKNIKIIKQGESIKNVPMSEVTKIANEAFSGLTIEELMTLGLDYWY